jgi:hypothetical protein
MACPRTGIYLCDSRWLLASPYGELPSVSTQPVCPSRTERSHSVWFTPVCTSAVWMPYSLRVDEWDEADDGGFAIVDCCHETMALTWQSLDIGPQSDHGRTNHHRTG